MLTQNQRARAIFQYGLGISPTEIGHEFGVTAAAIINAAKRSGMSVHYPRRGIGAEKRRRHISEKSDLHDMRANFHAAGLSYNESGTAIERDARGLLALVPIDTRTLTAILCGDPLPGRSALDRKEPK